MGNYQFCGEEAKYKFKNGNLCCSKHTNQCPERKRIISLQHKGKTIPDYQKDAVRKYMTGRKKTDECRRKLAEYKGSKHHMYGKKSGPMSDETKEKLRNIFLGKSWGKHTEETKSRLKISGRNKFKNPDYIKTFIKSSFRKPNKLEIKLEEIINSIIPDKYKFVGDLKVWIDGSNPDFINENDKKIIELFGDFWHSERIIGKSTEEHENDRISHFKNNGYDTLIIWEHELKDLNKLKQKIMEFNYEEN